jgi:ubiquinone biosynthesis protein UbiJ
MLQTLAFSIAEPLLSKVLAHDLSSAKKLEALEEKKLAVELIDLSIQVNLVVRKQKVLLSTNSEHADCKITLQLSALSDIKNSANITKLIKQDKLDLDGDIHVAQSFSDLLAADNINWQSLFGEYIGDANAYRLHSIIKKTKELVTKKLNDLSYTTSSALTDELRIAPTKLEVSQFIEDVDTLHAKAERLEHLLSQLEK